MRLYDIDDNPERKPFLDRLFPYMEERGTPIVQCPTISKQSLDLFKLYVLAKEKGGFTEVCDKFGKGSFYRKIVFNILIIL